MLLIIIWIRLWVISWFWKLLWRWDTQFQVKQVIVWQKCYRSMLRMPKLYEINKKKEVLISTMTICNVGDVGAVKDFLIEFANDQNCSKCCNYTSKNPIYKIVWVFVSESLIFTFLVSETSLIFQDFESATVCKGTALALMFNWCTKKRKISDSGCWWSWVKWDQV